MAQCDGELCEKKTTKYICRDCHAEYCSACYDLQEGHCELCSPPNLVSKADYKKKKKK
jgi:hypothetical protein